MFSYTIAQSADEKIFCPLLNKEIESGYCWELCNIGTDEILLKDDVVDACLEKLRLKLLLKI